MQTEKLGVPSAVAEILEKEYPLTKAQIIVMLGLILSIAVAFISIYNVASGIDQKEIACQNSNPDLDKALQTQFIVIIILSLIALIFGMVAAIMLKNNFWKFVPLSIAGAGIVGLIYSIGMKLKTNPQAKLGLSITLFLLFVLGALSVGFRGVGATITNVDKL